MRVSVRVEPATCAAVADGGPARSGRTVAVAVAVAVVLMLGPVAGAEPAPPVPPAPPSAAALAERLDALARAQAEAAGRLEAQRLELAEQRALLEAQRAEVDRQRAEIEATEQADANIAAATEDKEPTLRIYGFADMGLQRVSLDNNSWLHFITPSTATTFVMGNVNLYFDALPTPDWSFLTEVRLTNMPNGYDDGKLDGNRGRTSTVVFDATSSSGGWTQVKYGSIVIERAHITWQRYPWLQVRVGAILTPFGIWNQDHGTPTLIALMVPEFEARELFPTHQVGVEARGTHRLELGELGYHLYLTNGRTPGELSLGETAKLLGARVYLKLGEPRLTIGASGFVAHQLDQARRLVSTVPLALEFNDTVEYVEKAVGLDVSLDLGALRFRTELAARTLVYTPGKRAPAYGQDGLYDPDHFEWDVYALLAYRLPWLGLEPYLYGELYKFPTAFSDGYLTLSGGLNVHFTAGAQVKLQFSHLQGLDDLASWKLLEGPNATVTSVAVRLVLAF